MRPRNKREETEWMCIGGIPEHSLEDVKKLNNDETKYLTLKINKNGTFNTD